MEKRLGRESLVRIMLVAAALGFQAAYAAQEAPANFSADMISSAEGKVTQGKIYVAQDKMRTEMPGSVIIVRKDKNLTWMVMPAEGMYMEQPIDTKMLPKTSQEFEGEIERVSLGKETIDGKRTEKFQITYNEGAERKSAYQWVADSGFPVRMQALDGSWSVEYRNVSFATPGDELFEVPAGYKKFDMPFAQGGGVPSLSDIMSQVE